MAKTNIEWVQNPDGSQGYSWNPIQGLCPVDCKLPDGRSYCYARRIYERFKLDPRITHVWIKPPKKPSGVFVCSTIELFHSDIPKEWRDIVFKDIEKHPQHRFYILTKFPQNIDRPMPDNVWLGVSITKPSEMKRWTNLYFRQQANIKFVSLEPLLERLSEYPSGADWIIVGRLTGYGHKNDPDISWIKDIVTNYSNSWTKVFLKNNLKDIWGEPLIQEFPEGGR